MGKLYDFFIVGTGGTGGNLSELLCRFLTGVNREKYTVTLIDGDIVEKKNLTRQPFFLEDIGKNKAEALADYLGNCHDINVRFYDSYLDSADELRDLVTTAENMYARGGTEHIPVILGCVDNDACRKVLHEYFYGCKGDVIYIDSGNEFDFGEIVFGIKMKGTIVSPPKAFYYAEIMNGEHVPRSQLSCEELNNSSPQHLVTNMMAANIIMTGIARIFEEDECPTGIIYFNSMDFACRQQEWVPPKKALKSIDLTKPGGALYDF